MYGLLFAQEHNVISKLQNPSFNLYLETDTSSTMFSEIQTWLDNYNIYYCQYRNRNDNDRRCFLFNNDDFKKMYTERIFDKDFNLKTPLHLQFIRGVFEECYRHHKVEPKYKKHRWYYHIVNFNKLFFYIFYFIIIKINRSKGNCI